MTYAKTTWVDDVTATDAGNMNRIETGIDDLFKRRLVYNGAWTNAAPLVIAGLNGDAEGPYRIQVAGRLNIGAPAGDFELQMILTGTDAGGVQNSGNGRNSWIESYQNADNSFNPPGNNAALQDNHLFLGQVRWSESCEITTDALLHCDGGRYPTMGFVSTCKPMVTLDPRHMHAMGSSFLSSPRHVTGMTIRPSVATAGVSFSGRIIIDKLGLS